MRKFLSFLLQYNLKLYRIYTEKPSFSTKCYIVLHSSSFILALLKKKNVSQIQDKSLFVVTLFGDSKRVYDVKGL